LLETGFKAPALTANPKAAAPFALADLEDLRKADTLIAFTDASDRYSSGGRHVEFGVAVERGMEIYVIGPRENVFYALPEVNWFPTWQEFVIGSSQELWRSISEC
jgi:hypothetical protein